MPRDLASVVDSIPVRELIREGVLVKKLEALLAVEIGRASQLLAVGGNLKTGQTVLIASELIKDFPLSSLEDFCLMLRRGVKGFYQADRKPIWRFDIEIVYNWMRSYCEEIAQEKEKGFAREKSGVAPQMLLIGPAPSNDLSPETLKMIEQFKENLKDRKLREVPLLTPEEIRKEGREKPAKRQLPPSVSRETAILFEMEIAYARDCYDPYTGKENLNWVEFEVWKQLHRKEYVPNEIQSYRDQSKTGNFGNNGIGTLDNAPEENQDLTTLPP